MEWMHNCLLISVWNYPAWFKVSKLVRFFISLPVSCLCMCTHVSGERILCLHTKPQCILSFIGLTQRDSMRNQPGKTFRCWVFQEARSAQSWGEHREGGICMSLWQTGERVLSDSSCYCWDNLSELNNCPSADSHQNKVFILFSCLFPQVCLYGSYGSAECPGKETVSPPSERTSHGDQIWAGNLTKGGSLDNGV